MSIFIKLLVVGMLIYSCCSNLIFGLLYALKQNYTVLVSGPLGEKIKNKNNNKTSDFYGPTIEC